MTKDNPSKQCVDGDDFMTAICEAIGLDPARVAHFAIEVNEPRAPLVVALRVYVKPEDLLDIDWAKALERVGNG